MACIPVELLHLMKKVVVIGVVNARQIETHISHESLQAARYVYDCFVYRYVWDAFLNAYDISPSFLYSDLDVVTSFYPD